MLSILIQVLWGIINPNLEVLWICLNRLYSIEIVKVSTYTNEQEYLISILNYTKKRGAFKLPYLSEIHYLLDSFNILIIVELLLVTSCVSTIIFILTKNEYVSLLSSAPVCFVFSLWKFDNTHLFLLLVAMFLQALIIVIIQHQNNKKLKSSKKEKVIEDTDRLWFYNMSLWHLLVPRTRYVSEKNLIILRIRFYFKYSIKGRNSAVRIVLFLHV